MDKVNLNVNNIGEKTFSSWEACSFKPTGHLGSGVINNVLHTGEHVSNFLLYHKPYKWRFCFFSLFIYFLVQRQTECCAVCSLAASPPAVTFDAKGRWELCRLGHRQGRHRQGGLQGKWMRGMPMLLNTKFVFIDPCMHLCRWVFDRNVQ